MSMFAQFRVLMASVLLMMGAGSIVSAGELVTSLEAIPVSTTTGEKPQSKVWWHAGTWWAVLPSCSVEPPGTWLWRLRSDDSWQNTLRLSNSTATQADVKAVGAVVHVLLYDNAPARVHAELISLEYQEQDAAYDFWPERPTAAPVPLAGSETATLDVDSTGVLWIASDPLSVDGNWHVAVYHSVQPYELFEGPVLLTDCVAPGDCGVTEDDISVVTALPNATLGVLWSNQRTRRFGFRVHVDGVPADEWGVDEVPASPSAIEAGGGMADDHLNVAVGRDATLYAAVKTEYDQPGLPKIALLVRRPEVPGPGGRWDKLHEVDPAGTRGIVLLNEAAREVRVVYTSSEGLHDIVSKRSALSPVGFDTNREVLMRGGLNDAVSSRAAWSDQVVVLASGPGLARGRRLVQDASLVGHWSFEEGAGNEVFDTSFQPNHGAVEGGAKWLPGVEGLALDLDGANDFAVVAHHPSLDVRDQITLAAWVQPHRKETQRLIRKVGKEVSGYSLFLGTGGQVFVRFNDDNAYSVGSVTHYFPEYDHRWLHVAATYDGRAIRLYVNGEQEGVREVSFELEGNTEPLTFGANSEGGHLLNGLLDDLRIYDRALSPMEIRALLPPGGATAAQKRVASGEHTRAIPAKR